MKFCKECQVEVGPRNITGLCPVCAHHPQSLKKGALIARLGTKPKTWCGQCEALVCADAANLCASQWCKAKAVAA